MRHKLGRRRPVARGPRLRLGNYLFRSLPVPPEFVDYSAKAEAALGKMYLNDSLGDCVIAGIEHLDGVFTFNAGDGVTFTDADTERLYGAIGGYIPGKPDTDQGCDEQTALNYWQQNGLLPDGSRRIAGWMAVDGTNIDEVHTALWLFESLVFGIELPDAWLNPEPEASGFVWGVAGPPNPDNGHCVVGVGYDGSGVKVATWGMTGMITNAAVAKYATSVGSGELYTVLSQDAVLAATLKAPNGFDFSQLLADLDSFRP